jgi:hypothetical protein
MLITLIAESDGRCDSIVDEEGGPNHCDQVLRNINADPDDLWVYWIVLCSKFVYSDSWPLPSWNARQGAFISRTTEGFREPADRIAKTEPNTIDVATP